MIRNPKMFWAYRELMGAFESSWELIGAQGRLWELIGAHEVSWLLSRLEQCLILGRSHCSSILSNYSRVYHPVLESWTKILFISWWQQNLLFMISLRTTFEWKYSMQTFRYQCLMSNCEWKKLLPLFQYFFVLLLPEH